LLWVLADFNATYEKPLDTARDKSILIEDIVVDNPREGTMNIGIAGVPSHRTGK